MVFIKMSSEETDLVLDIEKPKVEPKDKFLLVYYLFFLLSVVHILPWTFFLTANSYWMYKFRNTAISEGNILKNKTTLQIEFSPCVTTALQISSVGSYFLAMFFRHKFNLKILLFGTLSVTFLSFVIAAVFIFINTDDWQILFFVITILLVAVISSMNAIFGITMMEVVACFPKIYLGIYLIGVGMATMFTAGLQLVSLAIGISTEDSALVYFWAATTIIAISIALLMATMKWNEFFIHHMKTHQIKKRKLIKWERIIFLTKKVWPGGAMMLFYCLTVLAIHPAITSLVVPENAGTNVWSDKYFIATITFLMHAVLDYVGRLTALKMKYQVKANQILVFCAIRLVVFVPLLLLCNAQPRHHLPVVFDRDYQYIIIMAFYGLTNGYCSHMVHYIIPTLVAPEDMEDGLKLNVIITSIVMAVLAFMSFVSVDIL